MSKLFEIVEQLRKARGDLAQVRRNVGVLEEQGVQLRKALAAQFIDQAGGAKELGSNQQERDLRIDVFLQQQPEVQNHAKKLYKLRQAEDALNCDVESLQDERRAMEWHIRLREAEAVTGEDLEQEIHDKLRERHARQSEGNS